jgi:hypothetical protein
MFDAERSAGSRHLCHVTAMLTPRVPPQVEQMKPLMELDDPYFRPAAGGACGAISVVGLIVTGRAVRRLRAEKLESERALAEMAQEFPRKGRGVHLTACRDTAVTHSCL